MTSTSLSNGLQGHLLSPTHYSCAILHVANTRHCFLQRSIYDQYIVGRQKSFSETATEKGRGKNREKQGKRHRDTRNFLQTLLIGLHVKSLSITPDVLTSVTNLKYALLSHVTSSETSEGMELVSHSPSSTSCSWACTRGPIPPLGGALVRPSAAGCHCYCCQGNSLVPILGLLSLVAIKYTKVLQVITMTKFVHSKVMAV